MSEHDKISGEANAAAAAATNATASGENATPVVMDYMRNLDVYTRRREMIRQLPGTKAPHLDR